MKVYSLAAYVLSVLVFFTKDALAISCGDPIDSCYENCGFRGTWCDCDSGCSTRGTCCEDYEECCLGCTPKCPKDYCGDDGCGGKCSCPYGPQWSCVNDQCICTPYCLGAECGKDGCGGLCGECPQGYICAGGKCVPQTCIPNCFAQECGNGGCPDQPDACGTCPPGKTCNVNGQCVGCEPQCTGKECGDDGCGGSCGNCKPGYECDAQGKCVCVPSCAGKACGPDGCGGICGSCPSNMMCNEFGQCEAMFVEMDILETQSIEVVKGDPEALSDAQGYLGEKMGDDDALENLSDLSVACPPGYRYSSTGCIPSSSSCPSGYVLSYGTCVPSSSHASASGGCNSHASAYPGCFSILLVVFGVPTALRLRRGGRSR